MPCPCVQSVLDLPIPRMLYHLSVCLSNLQVQETAQEFVELEVKQKEQQAAAQVVSAEPQQQKPPPTKGDLIYMLAWFEILLCRQSFISWQQGWKEMCSHFPDTCMLV